jgi:hypothetical protein
MFSSVTGPLLISKLGIQDLNQDIREGSRILEWEALWAVISGWGYTGLT